MTTHYKAVNEKLDKWTALSLKCLTKVIIPFYCFPLMIASYYKYFVMNSAKESFFMIYPIAYVKLTITNDILLKCCYIYFRIPYFDEKTPIGYLFVSVFTMVFMYYALTTLFCVLFSYFAFCVLLESFPLDIKQSFNNIDEKIKLGINKNQQLSMSTVVDVKNDVCVMVQFHGDFKQLSKTKKSFI